MDQANAAIALGNTAAAAAVSNHLKLDITNLLAHAEELRAAAGRTPQGRLLAIVCTGMKR